MSHHRPRDLEPYELDRKGILPAGTIVTDDITGTVLAADMTLNEGMHKSYRGT